jgi:hypothetical protein
MPFAAPLKKDFVQHPWTAWLVGYEKRRRAARRTILRYKVFLGKGGVVLTSARFTLHAPERPFAAPLKKDFVQHPWTAWLVGYEKRRRAARRTILRYKGFLGKGGVVLTSARFTLHAPERPFAAPLKYLTRAITSRLASLIVSDLRNIAHTRGRRVPASATSQSSHHYATSTLCFWGCAMSRRPVPGVVLEKASGSVMHSWRTTGSWVSVFKLEALWDLKISLS